GMRKNEPIEVVIRPEDIWFTLPDEGKFNVKVDTQLFRGVHYEIVAYDEFNNEWLIHSTHKAIVGETVGLDFDPEAIHIMRLNETEEEFDARIEEYVEEEETVGLANAVEEENAEEEAAIQEAVKEALENTMELTELAETVNEILQKQENEPESENKESGANK
ncbi:TOBE domain-containing protein, partial [Lactococcus lactis]|nr:TOBE domain-containing protein [Lactococcus lactis]